MANQGQCDRMVLVTYKLRDQDMAQADQMVANAAGMQPGDAEVFSAPEGDAVGSYRLRDLEFGPYPSDLAAQAAHDRIQAVVPAQDLFWLEMSPAPWA